MPISPKIPIAEARVVYHSKGERLENVFHTFSFGVMRTPILTPGGTKFWGGAQVAIFDSQSDSPVLSLSNDILHVPLRSVFSEI